MGNLLWNLYAKFYDPTVLNFSAYGELLDRVIALIKPISDQTVLNIGCGTGNLERCFIENENQFTWFGVDSSAAMLDIAKKKIGNDTRFQFVRFDMNEIDKLKMSGFDHVVMINSLYVAKDPRSLLKKIYDYMKDGGILLISNPKETSSIVKMLDYERRNRGLIRLLIIIIKLLPSLAINVLIRIQAGKGNYHFLSSEELRVILRDLGFNITLVEDAYADQSILLTAQK